MEEKVVKNSSKGYVVVIVILLLINIAMVLYMIYDKGLIFSKDKVDNQKTEEIIENKQEDIDINSALVQNLLNTFSFEKSYWMTVDDLNNSNLAKLRLAYDNMPKKNFEIISCSKFQLPVDHGTCGRATSEMENVIYNGDMVKFRDLERRNITTSISSKLIELKLHELFGSDYKVNHESFGLGTDDCDPLYYFMKYDKDK